MTIEQQSEDIVKAMEPETRTEEIETIASLLRELETWRNGADNMARECERLKAVLETSNLALVMTGESLAESRKLVAELELELAQANEWESMYDDQRQRAEKAEAELEATQAALADTKRFANMFARDWKAASDELEAARKVADAAVHYYDVDDGNVEWDAQAFCKFDDAVREYRAASPPLSPEKRAVIMKACDRTDEEWEELCKQQ